LRDSDFTLKLSWLRGGRRVRGSQIRIGQIGKRREARPPRNDRGLARGARVEVDRQSDSPTTGGSAADGGEIDRLPDLLNAAAFIGSNDRQPRFHAWLRAMNAQTFNIYVKRPQNHVRRL
jgi:hypothetical protein